MSFSAANAVRSATKYFISPGLGLMRTLPNSRIERLVQGRWADVTHNSVVQSAKLFEATPLTPEQASVYEKLLKAPGR